MSLINRMLGELAARQAPGTETLEGVRLNESLAQANANVSPRTAMLTISIAVGIALLAWWLWPRPGIAVPQPRGAVVAVDPSSASSAAVAEEPAPLAEARAAEAAIAPTTAMRAATKSGGLSLRLDASLRAPGAAVASAPPERETRLNPQPRRSSRTNRSRGSPRGLSERLAAAPQPVARVSDGGIQATDTHAAGQPAESPMSDLAARKRLARDSLARGEPAAALQSLGTTATDAESAALRAAALQRLGRHPEAAELYRSLTAADPREAGHWVGLGISLEGQERPDEAGAAYRRALENPALAPTLQKYSRQRLDALEPSP